VGKGERFQEDRIYGGKNSRVRSNAKSEHSNHRNTEAKVPPQLPHAVANVM
jgi:hypothetical protein